MGADFLIDEKGIIQEAFYGNVMGEHLSIHRVRAFAAEMLDPMES